MNTSLRTLACIALLALTGLALAQDLPLQFDPQRDAAKDLVTARELARSTGRHVLVDVGGEWCGWCRRFDQLVATQPQIKALIESRYVWLKVNCSRDNKNAAVLSQWPRIHGYPFFLVLDGSGKLMHAQSVQGLETESENEADENYDAAKIMAFLKRYASGEAVPDKSTAAGAIATPKHS